MEKDQAKNLKLKYKQVQRLYKEYNSYVKEVNKIQEKLIKEKECEVEDYYINKTNEYLQESESTRNAVKLKLRSYLDELMTQISEINDNTLKESEDFKSATDLISTCEEIFSKDTN